MIGDIWSVVMRLLDPRSLQRMARVDKNLSDKALAEFNSRKPDLEYVLNLEIGIFYNINLFEKIQWKDHLCYTTPLGYYQQTISFIQNQILNIEVQVFGKTPLSQFVDYFDCDMMLWLHRGKRNLPVSEQVITFYSPFHQDGCFNATYEYWSRRLGIIFIQTDDMIFISQTFANLKHGLGKINWCELIAAYKSLFFIFHLENDK